MGLFLKSFHRNGPCQSYLWVLCCYAPLLLSVFIFAWTANSFWHIRSLVALWYTFPAWLSVYHPLLAILPWLPFLLSDLIMWGCSQGSVLDPPLFLSIFSSLVISSTLMSMNAIYRPMVPKLICPVQIFLLQILISTCLLGIYTWMPNCLLKLNLFKTEFLFPWLLPNL